MKEARFEAGIKFFSCLLANGRYEKLLYKIPCSEEVLGARLYGISG